MGALLNPLRLTRGALSLVSGTVRLSGRLAFDAVAGLGTFAFDALIGEHPPEVAAGGGLVVELDTHEPERESEPDGQLLERIGVRSLQLRPSGRPRPAYLRRERPRRTASPANGNSEHAKPRRKPAEAGAERDGGPAAAQPPPAPAADPHVDTAHALVAESADPGAQNGAGARVRVEEPWAGYAKMTAPAISDRVVAENDAALSVVLLYERSHRARKSVVNAAERELGRRLSAGARAPR